MLIPSNLGHYEIISRLAASSASYLEIGVREGGSLRAALEHETIERLLLCDTWGNKSGGTNRGSHDHIVKLLKEIGYRRPIEFIDERSQTVNWSQRTGWWDLVNIDGSHEYLDALADMRNLWPMTRNAMVIHDISFPQVWKAVVKFAAGRQDIIAQCAFGDTGTLVLQR